MTIDEHIAALATAGRALAETAAEAGSDAEVATCPGWRVRDLLRHTTMVHRWATGFVAERYTSYHPDDGEPDLDGEALLAHFREGHVRLVDALRAAPESLECWTLMAAPSPLAFWARRQAHETAVHRADAESALPDRHPGPVDPALAADGIDELLRAFHARERSRVRTPEPRILRVRTTDTGDVWTVRLSQDPPRTEHDTKEHGTTEHGTTEHGTTGRGETGRGKGGLPVTADCEMTGPADRLYLTLWNRLPEGAVDVAGDASLARIWRENSAITWS
ncbi:maleylpyruvate isomerase family mycothiol-dependent enzyme [Streptomyces sp. Je 1-79]|uniref:maleylpyruvate isomerase family mycothiol-dependent enzyme n=1 Tax=Streptomyces sp. Je 1-79 TaxID=2943847 RepID=UPI0021A33D70|nr:maleylpyruvate isomerase family mycothiol-dependent enzyme [Streptomyces sp. Je 1-79]MCT4353855.1 maleylpyruvate isomerase family mycothiol-dependent enzyme [Streptomyces sp. Je 1-79]